MTIALSLGILFSFSALAGYAFDGSSKKSSGAKTRVTVAIIKADWCSACQKVEPIMMDLMKEYGGKINFVVLDVTNDETAAKAAATAKSLGISTFFEDNKKKTSTVGVFRSKTQTYVTAMNYNRSDYVQAFDRALK